MQEFRKITLQKDAIHLDRTHIVLDVNQATWCGTLFLLTAQPAPPTGFPQDLLTQTAYLQSWKVRPSNCSIPDQAITPPRPAVRIVARDCHCVGSTRPQRVDPGQG